MTEWVAVRGYFDPEAVLNPFFRSLSFELRMLVERPQGVADAVGADFVSALNHALEELDILFVPAGLTPIRMP